MANVSIIYESKYGNTKLVAEQIIAGIKETKGVEAVLHEVKSVNMDNVINSDAILIGSPNHWGRATGSIRKFIDRLGEINLNRIPVAVFDTCYSRELGKVVKKMERQISEKVPSLNLITPGLSIKLRGGRGPIPEEELTECRKFGKKIGEFIKD